MADVTMSRLPRAFQARRHAAKQGLDWIGFVKRAIGLVKAETPFIVLSILMELGTY